MIEVMTAVSAEAGGQRVIDVAKDGSAERETDGVVDVHERGAIIVAGDGSVQVQGQEEAVFDVKTEGLDDGQREGMPSPHPAYQPVVETTADGSVETKWTTFSSSQRRLRSVDG